MHSARGKRHIILDLGTSTLVGQLLTDSGDVLATAQVANPQVALGADILSRLEQAYHGEGRRLQTLLIEGLRTLVDRLLTGTGCSNGDIVSAVAAGNPGMSCLLRNFSVAPLLFPPHKPPYRELTLIPAREIDLWLPVPLQLFPLVSGFVGGDLVACLMTVENPAPGTLVADIGTNTEIASWDGSRWWVTSAAAGPAFEGGNISAGMCLADGAVTDVKLDVDRLLLTVAGGGEALGLCGSGLTALVAAARQGDLIDTTGRIRSADEIETNLGRYLVGQDGAQAIRFHYNAASELLLTQADLRNFQLAKGAVRAGVQVLLERCDIIVDKVARVLVTGALGSALPIAVLKRVALLPEPMLDKTSFVSNAVLAGLRIYLVSADGQQRLVSLMATLQPFPLSGTPAFENCFLSALEF